jgi:hypothetical protein
VFSKSGLPSSCRGLLQAACDVAAEVREEDYSLTSESFGRRVLEALMTRYEAMDAQERAKQIEHLSHYADQNVRKIAKRLKADMLRAA